MKHRAAGASGAAAGNAALAELLRQEGAPYDLAGLRALVAGVLAAPPGRDPAAWTTLVVPTPSPALRQLLLALAAEMRAAPAAAPLPPAERLARLRAELKRRRVHGFLVPRADEHQGEYVPSRAQRLAWLTGFTGSAGLAVVLPQAAAIFVDGRYTLQAQAEVDDKLYVRRHLSDEPAADWVAATLRKGEGLAYDPRLHTVGEVERFRAAAAKAGGSLKALDDNNPLDAVWSDQPPPPLAPVTRHELRFAGESAERKRKSLAEKLAEERGAAAAVSRSARGARARGRADRDRGRRWPRGIARRRRPFPRSELSHHLRRRAQRRHRALSRFRPERAPARAGHALSRRFRRAISRRHHRRHAHGGDRRADAGDARPLHPRAQGPHRARHLPLPQGHERLAARRAGASRAVGGRARLRPRHRPRRRQLSRRP